MHGQAAAKIEKGAAFYQYMSVPKEIFKVLVKIGIEEAHEKNYNERPLQEEHRHGERVPPVPKVGFAIFGIREEKCKCEINGYEFSIHLCRAAGPCAVAVTYTLTLDCIVLSKLLNSK